MVIEAILSIKFSNFCASRYSDFVSYVNLNGKVHSYRGDIFEPFPYSMVSSQHTSSCLKNTVDRCGLSPYIIILLYSILEHLVVIILIYCLLLIYISICSYSRQDWTIVFNRNKRCSTHISQVEIWLDISARCISSMLYVWCLLRINKLWTYCFTSYTTIT